MKRVFICLFILKASIFWSQELPKEHINKAGCGYDQAEQLLLQNPIYQQQQKEYEEKYQKILSERSAGVRNAVVYQIPTVVHIIHDCAPLGSISNPTDEQVRNIINEATTRFRHTHSGAGNYTNPDYGADTEIELCLASQDESGAYTTGIMRHQDPINNIGSVNSLPIPLTNQYAWDQSKYHNMFIVTSLTDAAGVYWGGYDIEIYNASSFWSGLIAHETGHYLSLIHIFDGCENDNCTIGGDKVCDTPPKNVAGSNSGSCSTPNNTCTTDDDDTDPRNPYRPIGNGGLGDQVDMLANYLDYTGGCWDAFTEGQKARMHANITTSRMALVNNANVACGSSMANHEVAVLTVDPGQTPCTNIFQPTITFRNNGNSNLTSLTLSANIAGMTSSGNWSGSLTTGNTAQITLSAISINTTGNFLMKGYSENPNGTNDQFKNNDTVCLRVNYFADGLQPSLMEHFSSCSVPNDFIVNNDNGLSWNIQDVLETCQGCVIRVLGFVDPKETASFCLPTLNLSNYTNTTITFQLGYIPRYNFFTNTLKIKVSEGCNTPTTVWSKADLQLATNTPPAYSANQEFRYPSCNEISQINIDLSNYDDLSQVDICFEADGHYWNPCVIDAITIGATPGGIADCTGYSHYVDDDPISTPLYHAKTTVTASGAIDDNSNIVFKAGDAINLEADFTVNQGGIFEATIEDCNDLSSLVNIVLNLSQIENAETYKNKSLFLHPSLNFENLELVNLKGETVFSKTRKQWISETKDGSQGLPINISDGVYYLKVGTDKKELIKRVVLEE